MVEYIKAMLPCVPPNKVLYASPSALPRNCKEESRAFAIFRFYPYVAIVLFYNSFTDTEADSCSLVVFLGV